jgi:hypothetical protein
MARDGAIPEPHTIFPGTGYPLTARWFLSGFVRRACALWSSVGTLFSTHPCDPVSVYARH